MNAVKIWGHANVDERRSHTIEVDVLPISELVTLTFFRTHPVDGALEPTQVAYLTRDQASQLLWGLAEELKVLGRSEP